MICKICKRDRPKNIFHRDHCHRTNLSRERICRSCNLMLGLAQDNVETLRNAANYLEEWSETHSRVRAEQIRELGDLQTPIDNPGIVPSMETVVEADDWASRPHWRFRPSQIKANTRPE
jgi:hypothetical protein